MPAMWGRHAAAPCRKLLLTGRPPEQDLSCDVVVSSRAGSRAGKIRCGTAKRQVVTGGRSGEGAPAPPSASLPKGNHDDGAQAMKLDHYHLSAEEIARCTCCRCGVNVIEAGEYTPAEGADLEGLLRLRPTDNLCIACIEIRLGRKLTIRDFASFPTVEGCPPSAKLLSRLPPPHGVRSRQKETGAQGVIVGLVETGFRETLVCMRQYGILSESANAPWA